MERERKLLERTRVETGIWALKVVLLVVGAISTATLFKVVVVTFLHDLAISTLPNIWSSLKASSASPLYIYLAVNLIIAAIAVTSTFGHKTRRLNSSSAAAAAAVAVSSLEKNNSWESFRILQEDPTVTEVTQVEEEEEEEKKEESWPRDSSSGAGEETSSMDETWKAIVAAKSGGLRRSETVVVERAGEDEVKKWARKEMRKWETFNERVVSQRIIREEKKPPMSTDELSRRSEALIKKVNDNMRLQRLESHQRNMVNRGL